LSNVVAIAAAGFYGNDYGYSLALGSNGTVTGWGAVSLPSDLTNVVSVAAGAYWWMALKSDGTVTANYPHLTNGLLALNGTPVSNVVAIASGDRHCLALRHDGTVVGWGVDYDGQATGVPSGTFNYTNGVVTLNGQLLSNAMAIAAGDSDSVALSADGRVFVWGNKQYGQANVPKGLSNVVALARGGNESANQVLTVKADGQLAAWGGSNAQTNVPAGLTNVVAAAVGSAHSLALVGAGALSPHARLSTPAWKTNCFTLTLPTQSGRVYSLEFKESLQDADWTAALLAAGSGHLQVLVHADATNSAGFYRVSQW
jgi:alpha-tubulin suppressor-like RCC1 family protein